MLQRPNRAAAAKRPGVMRPRFADENHRELEIGKGLGQQPLMKKRNHQQQRQRQQQQKKQPVSISSCPLELALDSADSKAADSSVCQQWVARMDTTDCDSSGAEVTSRSSGHWKPPQPEKPLPIYWNCGEFEIRGGHNCQDVNNSGAGQGVDMQNLPSVAEQMEKQRTWMTVFFRYRMNWYEAKPALSKMSREVAYRNINLPLWTRYVKVQLHRKTIFLNAIRAFRNRMQCATSGVRFTMNAFYRESDYKRLVNDTRDRDGPESKPLPYFRFPDDMPEIKTMVVAQMNVFVSNSTSYFDQFWEEALKESE